MSIIRTYKRTDEAPSGSICNGHILQILLDMDFRSGIKAHVFHRKVLWAHWRHRTPSHLEWKSLFRTYLIFQLLLLIIALKLECNYVFWYHLFRLTSHNHYIAQHIWDKRCNGYLVISSWSALHNWMGNLLYQRDTFWYDLVLIRTSYSGYYLASSFPYGFGTQCWSFDTWISFLTKFCLQTYEFLKN